MNPTKLISGPPDGRLEPEDDGLRTVDGRRREGFDDERDFVHELPLPTFEEVTQAAAANILEWQVLEGVETEPFGVILDRAKQEIAAVGLNFGTTRDLVAEWANDNREEAKRLGIPVDTVAIKMPTKKSAPKKQRKLSQEETDAAWQTTKQKWEERFRRGKVNLDDFDVMFKEEKAELRKKK